MNGKQLSRGLYCPELEHDNCGIGAVVNIKGEKSHSIVADALRIVENLEHRAGKDAEGKTGDGVGILDPGEPPLFQPGLRRGRHRHRRRRRIWRGYVLLSSE